MDVTQLLWTWHNRYGRDNCYGRDTTVMDVSQQLWTTVMDVTQLLWT